MNYLRKVVSGNRRRFKDEDYDLDITYITPRIIAMSFPAMTFMESQYRNKHPKVSKEQSFNKNYSGFKVFD